MTSVSLALTKFFGSEGLRALANGINPGALSVPVVLGAERPVSAAHAAKAVAACAARRAAHAAKKAAEKAARAAREAARAAARKARRATEKFRAVARAEAMKMAQFKILARLRQEGRGAGPLPSNGLAPVVSALTRLWRVCAGPVLEGWRAQAYAAACLRREVEEAVEFATALQVRYCL